MGVSEDLFYLMILDVCDEGFNVLVVFDECLFRIIRFVGVYIDEYMKWWFVLKMWLF